MNITISSSTANAQQFLSTLNKLSSGNSSSSSSSTSTQNTGSSTIGSNSSSSASTSTTQQRFALSLNQNIANINNNTNVQNSGSNAQNMSAAANSLLRSIQLSPNSSSQLKSKLNLNSILSTAVQQAAASSQSNQNNSNSTQSTNNTTNTSNYPLNQNLQNQINYLAAQQQKAANNLAAVTNTSTLLAAATLLAATTNTSAHNSNLNSTLNSLYQQQQQQQQQQQVHQHQQAQNSTCNLNNTLFVGNLHASLQEMDLIQVFRPFGRIVECCKKWLHFGFVKFTTEEEACHAYVTLNGFRLKGRPMRLEFQNRSKKARIKAILAQTGPTTATANENTLLSMGNYGNMNIGSSGYGNFTTTTNHHHHSNHHNQYQNGQFNGASNLNLLSDDRQNYMLNNFQNGPSSTGFYNQQQHHQQQSNHQFSLKHNESALNNFFNADQLLKFATSLDQMDKELTIPEFNFDLIGGSASTDLPSASSVSSSSNFYEFNELDLKLSDDNLSSSDGLASGSSTSANSAGSNYHFLDVNYPGGSTTTSAIGGPKNDDIVMSLIKNTISPVESPKHDTSSSLSTDSGCRSNSFLNDEDSAICSVQTQMSSLVLANQKSASTNTSMEKKEITKKKLDDFCCNTISEHLEFTCSNNSSPVKLLVEVAEKSGKKEVDEKSHVEEDEDNQEDDDDNDDDCSSDCDTSDDASDLPDEHLSTSSDCLNDLDLDFELVSEEMHAAVETACGRGVAQDADDNQVEMISKYNQVVEKDGSVARKKLNSGIYKSVNQTLSLFIEPHDILKKMEMNEFDEYSLFPSGSNGAGQLECASDLDVDALLKNHFYSV